MAFPNSAGGPGIDQGFGISTLPDGSSIITGWFTGTASFGSTTLSAADANEIDGFVAKLDSNGNYLWAKKFGGGGTDESIPGSNWNRSTDWAARIARES